MTFSTKASMWWGSVTTTTEGMFGKPKKKFTTHEYYDNPNPASARPRSMHTMGSMRKASQRQGANDYDEGQPQDAGFDDQQGYQQGYDEGVDPNQGYPQEQGYDQGDDQGFDPNQGYPQEDGVFPAQNYDQGYAGQGQGYGAQGY